MTNKLSLFLIAIFLLSFSDRNKDSDKKNNINKSKPYTYWWWHGNAVDSVNIAYNLEMMQRAGIGGVHIVPIYGVKGMENKSLDYLSPQWVEMVKYSSRKASELGMEVDMTLGTGWCYGGKWVENKNGVMDAVIDIVENCKGKTAIDLSPKTDYPIDTVLHVLAVYENGSRIDITLLVSDHNIILPDSQFQATIYILRMFGPVTMVKRAAPGAGGPMLNPLSARAFKSYVSPYENAFQDGMGKYISSIYHDSYEYYHAKWSVELLDKFEENRGYKLEEFLPELMDKGNTDLSRRVIADYRQTVFELHENYIQAVKNWADQNNVTFRNQAHGSPTNWLDIYAIADIPETESFGSSPFKIPKFERENDYISIKNVPNADLYKFSSSAAHVTGKPLVSCETHTWLREHFRVALSHCKPELDKLFVSGINHIYYHGSAYSPKEEVWPGWLFYASTNFASSNSQYYHFLAQNKYIENCQKILQSTNPDNEIVVYFPFQDILHNCNLKNDISIAINVHNVKEWLFDSEFQKTILGLKNKGFSYDFISDLQLINSKTKGNELVTTGNKYKTLIVPKCEYIPLKTIQKIAELAINGVNIIFIEDLPEKYSGYSKNQKSQISFEKAQQKLYSLSKSNMKIINTNELSSQLVQWENKQEKLALYGLDYIRKKDEAGYIYFISNMNSGKEINRYIPVSIINKEYVLYNPLTGVKGIAKTKKSDNSISVFMQLKQGQSLFLFANNKKENSPFWNYTGIEKKRIPVSGNWTLDFLEGGPILPKSVNLRKLISWTNLPDTMASYFSGIARYHINFTFHDFQKNIKYILVFDKVKESVLIRINGEEVITLFSYPYEADISKFLRNGENHLELEVANLSANRIRYLDKQKVDWQKFYDVNFVNINYKKFDASKWDPVESGIIGDVSILCYENE